MSAENQTAAEAAKTPRLVEGLVVSDKMNKSCVVLVERKIRHPLYKKYIRRSSRMHVHDENNECRQGDLVEIEACRPISKTKTWRLHKVVTRAN
jgi:small subunit ribosomal protein S17